MPSNYVLQIVRADELLWKATALQSTPSPAVEVSLDGRVILTSSTQERTFAPKWNEEVEFLLKQLSSEITIEVYHEAWAKKWISQIAQASETVKRWGSRRLLGSVRIKAEDLMRKTRNEEKDVCLELSQEMNKAGNIFVRFLSMAPPDTNEPDAATKVVPPELRPDYSPPTMGGYKMQIAGFREKEVDIGQSERIVQQILEREKDDQAIDD